MEGTCLHLTYNGQVCSALKLCDCLTRDFWPNQCLESRKIRNPERGVVGAHFVNLQCQKVPKEHLTFFYLGDVGDVGRLVFVVELERFASFWEVIAIVSARLKLKSMT